MVQNRNELIDCFVRYWDFESREMNLVAARGNMDGIRETFNRCKRGICRYFRSIRS